MLFALLGRTLNMPDEQVAPLLYQKGDDDSLTETLDGDALNRLLALDKDRVQKLSKPEVNTKEFFDNGYKAAQAEVAEKMEKKLRAAFGVDTEMKLKGDALLSAIKAAAAGEAQNPDKVKTSQEYLALEQQMREQVEGLTQKHATELDTLKANFQREQQWATVSDRLRATFKGLAPVLPGDAAKAEAQTAAFINTHFRDYDFTQTEDGRWLPMKNGQRLNNDHGHAMYLEDLVKSTASQFYDFDLQQQIGNAGNRNDGKPAAKFKFKDEGDFLVQFSEAKAEEKAEMSAAWEAMQQG